MIAARSLRTHALHALLLLSALVGTSLLSSTADAMRLRRCRQGCGKNGMCKANRRKYFCKRRGFNAARDEAAPAPGDDGGDLPPPVPLPDDNENETIEGEEFYLYLCSGLPYEDYYVQPGDIVPETDPVSTLLPDMASPADDDFFALPGGAYGDGLPETAAANADFDAPAPVQDFTAMAEATVLEGGYGYGGIAAVYGEPDPGLVECPTVVYVADLELGDDEEVSGPNAPQLPTTGPPDPSIGTGQPNPTVGVPGEPGLPGEYGPDPGEPGEYGPDPTDERVRRPRGERPPDPARERRPRRTRGERRGRGSEE